MVIGARIREEHGDAYMNGFLQEVPSLAADLASSYTIEIAKDANSGPCRCHGSFHRLEKVMNHKFRDNDTVNAHAIHRFDAFWE